MSRDLPQERLQCPAVRLPLSQTQKTCRENTKRMRNQLGSALKELFLHCCSPREGVSSLTQLFQSLGRCIHLRPRWKRRKLQNKRATLNFATKQIHNNTKDTQSEHIVAVEVEEDHKDQQQNENIIEGLTSFSTELI